MTSVPSEAFRGALILCLKMMNVPAFQGLDHAECMMKMMQFMEQFNEVINGTMDATLVLEDTQNSLCYIEVSDCVDVMTPQVGADLFLFQAQGSPADDPHLVVKR